MKRNRMLIGVATFMLAMTCMFVGPAMADGVGTLCNELSGLFGVAQDTCAKCVVSGLADAVCTCKILGDTGVLELLGINHGQCVKALK